MKNLKLLWGFALFGLLFTSCEKGETLDLVQNSDTPIAQAENVVFVPADEADMEDDMALLESILNGEFEENGQESIDERTCCDMQSLTKATAPWGSVNLKVRYILSEASQQVQIKHWHKPPGGSYSYYGMNVINNSSPVCTQKSVNTTTDHLPDDGTFISWARINNGACGGNALLWHWTK